MTRTIIKLSLVGIIIIMTGTAPLFAQRTHRDAKYVYTEASSLNIIGKIMPTSNPYHRVDTSVYKGFTTRENFQVRCSSGLAVVFRTNSSSIKIKASGDYSFQSDHTMRLASHGYDLYISRGGKWIWAENVAPSPTQPDAIMSLINNSLIKYQSFRTAS